MHLPVQCPCGRCPVRPYGTGQPLVALPCAAAPGCNQSGRRPPISLPNGVLCVRIFWTFSPAIRRRLWGREAADGNGMSHREKRLGQARFVSRGGVGSLLLVCDRCCRVVGGFAHKSAKRTRMATLAHLSVSETLLRPSETLWMI